MDRREWWRGIAQGVAGNAIWTAVGNAVWTFSMAKVFGLQWIQVVVLAVGGIAASLLIAILVGIRAERRPAVQGPSPGSLAVRFWMLREVCIHFLMNRLVTTDERAQIQRKAENFRSWEAWVEDSFSKAGLSELDISNFRSLGLLPRQLNPANPDHALLEDIITEKYRRFEAIVRDLQSSGRLEA